MCFMNRFVLKNQKAQVCLHHQRVYITSGKIASISCSLTMAGSRVAVWICNEIVSEQQKSDMATYQRWTHVVGIAWSVGTEEHGAKVSPPVRLSWF